jgi:hypothetical protein
MVQSWIVEYLKVGSIKEVAAKYNASAETVWHYLRIHLPDKIKPRGGRFKTRSIKELTGTEFAYLAGIFDGEGSLRATIKVNKAGKQIYGIAIYIVNTDMKLMTWMKSLGGSLRTRKPNGLGHKPIYIWSLSSTEDLLYFLNGILPYSKHSKSEALQQTIQALTNRIRRYQN